MIALSTGSLHTYGIARVAHLAVAAGFDGLELMVDERWDTRDGAYLNAVTREAAIPIVSVHAPFRPWVPGWDADQVSRVRRTVELARAIGARTVVTHPPVRYRWIALRHPPFLNVVVLTPIPHRSRYHRWLVSELDAYAARSGVTIAVENMPRHRLGPRPVNLFDMNGIRDLRHFSAITLDTTHVGTWGMDLLDTYNVLADRVAHVHLSNYNGRQHRLPDDGSLALDAFLAALRRRGYAGVIAVELEPDAVGAGDDERVREGLASAAAFCRRHFR